MSFYFQYSLACDDLNTAETGSEFKDIKAENEEGEILIKCFACDASFTSKKYLQKHIDRIHKGKKPYTCNDCNFHFKSKRTLIGHNTSVHQGRKPFKCDICEKGFQYSGNLTRHITRTHS